MEGRKNMNLVLQICQMKNCFTHLTKLVKRCTHGILLFHLIRSRKKISISRNKEDIICHMKLYEFTLLKHATDLSGLGFQEKLRPDSFIHI
ncbi:hypothetical protein Y1Q_0020268 [Alligator mississippiensis]|uniref:Uncharacterized protein n=1 Tax=Alligator mississippiensis TaxID=8496 RepID=A0A151PIK5_ALLMI|nr:hypothetical protein Y1Q_0020268 [Alligator mississippiensis]